MNPPPPKVPALEATAYDQGKGWRKGQHLIDALPYIDHPTPEVRRQVEALINEEMERSVKRPQDYLKDLPAPGAVFPNNPLLAAEYERVKQRQPMPPLDVSRYRLDPPPMSRKNDYAAWRAAVDNAYSQLEHQQLRIINLEILLKYGANNWRAQNQLTEVTNKVLEEELQQLKSSTEQINKERKLQQMEAGQQLSDLERQWMEVTYKNIAIEKACSQLEHQVGALQQQLAAKQQQEEAAAAAAAPAAPAAETAAAAPGDAASQEAPANGPAAGAHHANGAPQESPASGSHEGVVPEANGPPHSNGSGNGGGADGAADMVE